MVPKVMLGWAEGMESAVIPNNILHSKATLCCLGITESRKEKP